MEALSSILQWTSSFVYVALAYVSTRIWSDRRSVPAKWLAATFASLGAIVLLGVVQELFDIETLPLPLTVVVVAVLALFPYFLLRFADAFEPVSTGVLRVAVFVVAVITVMTAVVPLPGPDEPATTASLSFTAVFMLFWISMSVVVIRQFWRAGAGQPTVIRARMRLLASAAMLLAVTLLLSSANGSSTEISAFSLLVQMLGIISGVTFLLAFSPPTVLRSAWRSVEEAELQTAALNLMGATGPREVTDTLLPHVAAVIGAGGVLVLANDGEILGEFGEIPAARDGGADDHVLRVPMSVGQLIVYASRYTPFFGSGEESLVAHLGLLADLAIARTSLLERERIARAEAETAGAALAASHDEMQAFVHAVSHDLKSPLTVITGYLSLYVGDYGESLDDTAKDWLNRVQSNVEFMSSLIADLLQLSRIGRVEDEHSWVDLRPTVRDIVANIGQDYPAVRVDVGPLPHVFASKKRMRQLFTNLIENAAKYGGRPDLHIAVGATVSGDHVEIHVADDGQGIPEADRERVFGVFTRLAEGDTTGTGIGLSVCRRIVEQAGGTISVAPSDSGADFRILLPLARATLGAPPASPGRTATEAVVVTA